MMGDGMTNFVDGFVRSPQNPNPFNIVIVKFTEELVY
jgi:hypothetical protein